jgi:transposase
MKVISLGLRRVFGREQVSPSHQAPDRDAIFVFINRRHTRAMSLCFDGTGTWLATKRHEHGTFSWPLPSELEQAKLWG